MTDYDKLTGLLKQFDVTFEVAQREDGDYRVYIGDSYAELYGETIVDEYKGDEDKVNSYYGFYTYYCFDSNKKFKSIGIYE